MAMMQWCGSVARRVMMTQRHALTSTGGGVASIVCGRVGTGRRKKGKRFKGSYPNAMPKKEKKIEQIKDKVEVPSSTPWPLPFISFN